MFEKLPPDHPARAPFNLFSQSSDTVKSGIILGLGTRLQVLQNKAVKQLISFSDIDLTAPGSHKCAYYIILSDQETSMAFLQLHERQWRRVPQIRQHALYLPDWHHLRVYRLQNDEDNSFC